MTATPPSMILNEFMLQTMENLRSERKLAESTVVSYLKILYALNDKKPFKTFAILRKTEPILAKVAAYALSTQKSILGAICSVLSLVKDKGAYKKTYNVYADQLREKKGDPPETPDGEKTKREEDNWLTWEDVEKRRTELESEIAAQKIGKSGPTPSQWQTRLNYMVLCLYTMVQPRRNQDYQVMKVVPSGADKRDTSANYIDLGAKKMVFNVYKTSKKYGQKSLDIPDPLMSAIETYLKFHPLRPTKKGVKDFDYTFLVDFRGTPFTAVNAMTRLLNRIFGRKVGSSLLRHIYLSSKYNLADMKETAEAMGHSLDMQRKYLRVETPAGGAGDAGEDDDSSDEEEAPAT